MRPATYAAAERLSDARDAWWSGDGTYSGVIDAVDGLLDAMVVEACDELFPVIAWRATEQVGRDMEVGKDGGMRLPPPDTSWLQFDNWRGRPAPCRIPQPRGWRCRRNFHADGPCASLPRRWNLAARWRYRDTLGAR